MVQITVKMPGPTPEDCPEWVIIDLQGNLETRHQVPLSDKFIGDLHFTKKDVPVLIIGHHILYGKIVEMDKPFAVLSKSKTESCDQDVSMETDNMEDVQQKVTSYTVKAIVKKKLLFKTRPKPIIAHVPKTI